MFDYWLSSSLDIPSEFALWAFLFMPTCDSSPSIQYSPPRDCPIYLKMMPTFLSSSNMGSPPCLCIIISPGWQQSSLYVNTMQMFFNISSNSTCFVNPCLLPDSAMALSSLTRSALPASPFLPVTAWDCEWVCRCWVTGPAFMGRAYFTIFVFLTTSFNSSRKLSNQKHWWVIRK